MDEPFLSSSPPRARRGSLQRQEDYSPGAPMQLPVPLTPEQCAKAARSRRHSAPVTPYREISPYIYHQLGDSESVVSCCEFLSYGTGGFGVAWMASVNNFYITSFWLRVAGLTGNQAAIISIVGRIIDGITDPITGVITDRTRTRWGRRRPWMLAAIIPGAASYFSLYYSFGADEARLSSNEKLLYYICTYVFYNAAFSLYEVPYTALALDIGESRQDRDRLTAARTVCEVGIGPIVGVVAQGFIVNSESRFWANDAEAYMVAAAIGCAIFVVSAIISTGMAKERTYKEVAQGTRMPTIWDNANDFREALSIPAYRIVSLTFMCSATGVGLATNNILLYITFVWDREDEFQYLLGTVLSSSLLAIVLYAMLIPKYGKRPLYLFALCLIVPACALLYFMPRGSTAWPWYVAYIVCFVAGSGIGPCVLIPWAMVPDIVNADELKCKRRREGVFCSLFVFLTKFTAGVALGASNALLDYAGFVPPDEDGEDVVQPEAVQQMLRILCGPVPAAMLVLACSALYWYPLTEDMCIQNRIKLTEMRRQDAAKHAAAKAGPAPET